MSIKKNRRARKSLGERIAERLEREHGLKLDPEPCNYEIVRDQTAIMINLHGGSDYPTWSLRYGRCHNPSLEYDGIARTFEIGSSTPASKLIKCKIWAIEVNAVCGTIYIDDNS